MNLSERKRKILYALVDSYINNAEPIASGSIQAKYLPDVSSATIRGELSALEDLGFLVKPHVSAGRVPSTMAYKYYVENLERGELEAQDLAELRTHFDLRMHGLEDIVKDTAKIISDKTNYTSVVLLKDAGDVVIKNVKMTELGDGTALVIIITDSGTVRDKIVKIPENMPKDYIATAETILKDAFLGRKVGDSVGTDKFLDGRLGEFRVLFEQVVEMLVSMRGAKKTIYVDGKNKIFEYPEYDDVNNVKQFLSVIEDEKLTEIMENDEDIEISIKIGKDAGKGFENMAVVTAKYTIDGKEIGRAGVIGPERMNYKQVIKVLSGVKKATKRIAKNKQ